MDLKEATIKVLTDAKALVKKGWLQHEAVDRASGRMCAGQAISEGWQELVDSKTGLELDADFLNTCTPCRDANMALLAAANELTGTDWGFNIPNWNDYDGRTQDEVVDTFDHAIKLVERDTPLVERGTVT